MIARHEESVAWHGDEDRGTIGLLARDLAHELRDVDRNAPQLQPPRLRLAERDEIPREEQERLRTMAQRLDARGVERARGLRGVERLDHLLRRHRQLVLEDAEELVTLRIDAAQPGAVLLYDIDEPGARDEDRETAQRVPGDGEP